MIQMIERSESRRELEKIDLLDSGTI